jgi:preprotein translocase subunit Sec61beta
MRDDRISLPSSGAGITRYFDDEKSNIMLSPRATIIGILAVIVIILLLTGL